MRIFTLLSFLCLANFAKATNYYFSTSSGDDTRTSLQAQNPATPWKSVDKFNSITAGLKAGDSVFFKRGEVFYGMMSVKTSGRAGADIYFGAYGSGANPVISGFVTVSNWTPLGGGIYYAPVNGPALMNMVTLNGEAKGMGRWPNSGFLQVDSHVGNKSITSSGLATGTDWSGGEVVVRKYRFILDRHNITSQSGTTLNYGLSSLNGNNAAFVPVDKNGFFIQNHLKTLDQFGEWYYDPAAKRLYVHFGKNAPSSYEVKASVLDYNMYISTVNFVKLENLNFEGGNNRGIYLNNSTNLQIKDCNFFNQGGASVYGVDLNWVWVTGGSVNTSFSNGINLVHNANNCTVDGVAVSNTNMIPGSGRSGNGISIGITINGDNAKILNNRVINSGYSAIQFLGNNVLVEKNFIDTYCTLKDDGGGVYTFEGASNETNYNRKIRNNIILNAPGAWQGAESYWYEAHGKGAGIYLDEYVNNVEISGNTIANGDWSGIFMHNAHDCQITNNIIYNHRYQMHVSQYTAATRNMVETNNQYISKYAFQDVWYYRTFVADNPSSMGTSNNNYFARPIDDNKVVHCDFLQSGGAGTKRYTFEQWQSNFGLDAASKKSPITYQGNINDSIRFEYNASNTSKVVSLDGSYLDVKGNQYAGVVTLAPFTSVVLLKTRSAIRQNQVIAFPDLDDKIFGAAPFALTATASSGLPVSYRVVNGPATVSDNMVTLTGTGTVAIEASQAGNNTFNAASPVQQSFSVRSLTVKQNQTINFPAITDKTYGDAPFVLTANATSGLAVDYRVLSGPATVSGNKVTLTGTGEVWIEASQGGNDTYLAAPSISQRLAVAKASQAINFPAIANKELGDDPFVLNATATSGLPVSYRVLSGPATVSGNKVTLTGTGEVWIEASQGGDANYTWAWSTSQHFVVAAAAASKEDQTISFPAIGDKTFGAVPFTVAATASSGLPVSFRVVSGPASSNGNKITITGAGTVTVEASQAGNANFNAASPVQRSFTVDKASQQISFGALANKVLGDPIFALNATASSGLPVLYRVVSGPATITGNTVSLTGAGVVKIEATQPGDQNYEAATPLTQSFAVASPATTKQNQTIFFGTLPYKTYGNEPFELSALASSGLPVSYRVVSGPATLAGNTVTITDVGNVTIEAVQDGNDDYYPAAPVQRSFTVGKAGQAITFANPENRTFGDGPFELSATASSGLPVSYRIVSGPAKLSGDVISLTGLGTVTVEASQEGNENYSAAYPITRKFQVVPANTVLPQAIQFPVINEVVYGEAAFPLSATASSGLPVSYRVVSGPATLAGNNYVKVNGAGVVTIEASQAGNDEYSAALPETQSFTVIKADQTVIFDYLTDQFTGGEPFRLNAKASSGLPVSYRVVSGPATVSGNTVTITGAGVIIIEASQEGDANYNEASAVTQSFTARNSGKVDQIITFGTLAYKFYDSEPFDLSATASSGLPVSYRVVSGPATITDNIVTITGLGFVTIEASQDGDNKYNPAAPVQRSFTVGKSSQILTFALPAGKTYGDAPFALNATSTAGLPVSYRVILGPATVSGNTVTITGVGAVMIEASQPGNDYYNAAYPLVRSFVVTPPVWLPATTEARSQEQQPEIAALTASTIRVYPNPVRTNASVVVTAAKTLTGSLAIYNLQGGLVKKLAERSFEKGVPTTVSFNLPALAGGGYVIRLVSKDGVVTQRFEVVK